MHKSTSDSIFFFSGLIEKDSSMPKENSYEDLNPLSANPTKWSNTLKQFAGNLPTTCFSVFDHFVKLLLKGLIFCFF